MVRTIIFTCLVVSAFSASAADVAAGKGKAATCVACHGANGISLVPIYPNLAGQKAAYLAKQLKAFRDGGRVEPLMQPFVAGLSDDDIVNISAYFSSLKSE